MEIEEFNKLKVGYSVTDFKGCTYVIRRLGVNRVYVEGMKNAISRFALKSTLPPAPPVPKSVGKNADPLKVKAKSMPSVGHRITLDCEDIRKHGFISAVIISYLRSLEDRTFYGSIRALREHLCEVVRYNSLVASLLSLEKNKIIETTKLGTYLTSFRLRDAAR